MAEEVRNGRHEKLVELGELIRARRENLGLSIEEVQEKTKIRSRYLRAIEAGDDRIPPGKAYFRVFLKSYAEFLGLDGLELSRAYKEIAESNNRYRPPVTPVQDGPKASQPWFSWQVRFSGLPGCTAYTRPGAKTQVV
jgi:cytoskeletal protein RodZ